MIHFLTLEDSRRKGRIFGGWSSAKQGTFSNRFSRTLDFVVSGVGGCSGSNTHCIGTLGRLGLAGGMPTPASEVTNGCL
jgi:hypothetical protein